MRTRVYKKEKQSSEYKIPGFARFSSCINFGMNVLLWSIQTVLSKLWLYEIIVTDLLLKWYLLLLLWGGHREMRFSNKFPVCGDRNSQPGIR